MHFNKIALDFEDASHDAQTFTDSHVIHPYHVRLYYPLFRYNGFPKSGFDKNHDAEISRGFVNLCQKWRLLISIFSFISLSSMYNMGG